MASLLVGIAGGSGSGKTTLAKAIAEAMAPGQVVVIPHDAYYRDLSHLSFEERGRCNFDEPAALDNERLIQDLQTLRDGGAVARPNYDFTSHRRRPEATRVEPCPVVVVEGILVLAVPALRALLDVRVFVEASERIRQARRMERDVAERGRTREGSETQYIRQTRPMHDLHVEPSKCHADILVSGEGSVAHVAETVRKAIGKRLDCGIRA